MVGRTAAQGRIPALKRTVFTSHGENARRIGRIRREPALSGAFREERTPHFARSFLPSPECGQNVETGWRRKGDLNSRDPSAFDVDTVKGSVAPESSLERFRSSCTHIIFRSRRGLIYRRSLTDHLA